MDRPVTTLFMLMSVDGKISTGNIDDRDVDRDFPRISGIKEGLKQYYDIEKTINFISMNTGRVMQKVGANDWMKNPNLPNLDLSFILIDNKPHLENTGIEYFVKKTKFIYLVTNNKEHPAFQYKDNENIAILYYEDKIDFRDLFYQLKNKYGIESMAIQSGGTLNSTLLREKLIDKLSIVITPALIGGKETSTLIDGESLQTFDDLKNIKALKLIENKTLNDSYINLTYEVINETEIV